MFAIIRDHRTGRMLQIDFKRIADYRGTDVDYIAKILDVRATDFTIIVIHDSASNEILEIPISDDIIIDHIKKSELTMSEVTENGEKHNDQ